MDAVVVVQASREVDVVQAQRERLIQLGTRSGIKILIAPPIDDVTDGLVESLPAAREAADAAARTVHDDLDQASGHVVASALKAAAEARGLFLFKPEHSRETAGAGMEGHVDGRHITVGGLSFVAERSGVAETSGLLSTEEAGGLHVAVGVDGRLAGL